MFAVAQNPLLSWRQEAFACAAHHIAGPCLAPSTLHRLCRCGCCTATVLPLGYWVGDLLGCLPLAAYHHGLPLRCEAVRVQQNAKQRPYAATAPRHAAAASGRRPPACPPAAPASHRLPATTCVQGRCLSSHPDHPLCPASLLWSR